MSPKRSYQSPRREASAEETRRRVVETARRLFVENGYAATTIASIAAEAGVAVQTVYAVFGSKAAVLMAILDQMAQDADLARLQSRVAAAAGDPRRQLREVLAFTGRLYESGSEIIELARTVSGVEPDLAAMWHEGEERRHRNAQQMVAEWSSAGALAPGMSRQTAIDMLWSFSGPDVFRLLVAERGWSQQRRLDRLAQALEAALFGDG